MVALESQLLDRSRKTEVSSEIADASK